MATTRLSVGTARYFYELAHYFGDRMYAAYVDMYHTLNEFRPATAEIHITTNVYRKCITTALAAEWYYKQAKAWLSTYDNKSLGAEQVHSLIENWDLISKELNANQKELIGMTFVIIEEEITRQHEYIALFQFFEKEVLYDDDDSEHPVEFTESDTELYNLMRNVHIHLAQLANITLLFMHNAPEFVDVDRWYISSDAVYYALSKFLEKVLETSTGTKVSKRFKWLAKQCCDLRYLGPVHHLKHPEIEDAMDIGILPDSNAVLIGLIKVDDEAFDELALNTGRDIANDKDVMFYNTAHMLILYDRVMRRVVRMANSLNVELQRTTFYLLNLVFSDELFMQKAHQILANRNADSDLFMQFLHIKDFLSTCTDSFNEVRNMKGRLYEIQSLLNEYFEPLSHIMTKDVRLEALRVRNNAVCNIVISHYQNTIEEMIDAMVRFVLEFSEKVAKLSTHPRMLGLTYTFFKETMYLYKAMSEELLSAVTETNPAEKMIALTSTITAVPILEEYFRRTYESLNTVKKKHGVLKVQWVAERLPLYIEISDAVQNEMKVVFKNVGKIDKLRDKPPRRIQPYFERVVVEFDTLQIPSESILTPEEFSELFQRVYQFSRYPWQNFDEMENVE